MISFGVRPVEAKDDEDDEETSASKKDTETPPEPGSDKKKAPKRDKKKPERSSLQIWHSSELRIVPGQKAQADRDKRRTLLKVWRLEESQIVRLGSDSDQRCRLLSNWKFAIERDEGPYAWGQQFGYSYQIIHWSGGVPEVDHWDSGQERMEVSFWEDPGGTRQFTRGRT
ncbi:MAG: hypothetical protein V3W41_00695 [Planctomycetota bacterium]